MTKQIEIPFILSVKQKKWFIEQMRLDQLKDYARCCGFNVIYLIDKFNGPVREEIWL